MGAGANLFDPGQLLGYFTSNPWDAASITWTLNLDATPIYAIQPRGSFGREGFERLRQFLGEQATGDVERISIAGIVSGKIRLFTGQVVPVVWPDLRGMYSWTTAALINAVIGVSPPKAPKPTATAKEKEEHQRYLEEYRKKTQPIRNYLERVYFELRNLGITPRERAVNFAATNAFSAAKVFESAIKDEMELDNIGVERVRFAAPSRIAGT
jgi:hypothetical protein